MLGGRKPVYKINFNHSFWRGITTEFFEELMKTLDSYPDRFT